MRLLKKLHKWVGLLIGIQVLVWLISGLVISLIDPAKVSGSEWVRTNATEAPGLGTAALLEPAELPAAQLKDALGIDLITRHGRPMYLVRHAGGETLVDASDASVVQTGKAEAGEIARQDFAGSGEIISIERGMAPDLETRDSMGAYWKVNFSDQANTSIYISESTGNILERRNSFWRVRDFFWMLHIMDYPKREDFNNALIIITALVAIWLGISGFLLLFGSFKRHDFFFLNIFAKPAEAVITLHDPALDGPRQIKLRKGGNLFLSLATRDINLPSICGGGGECGKCRVRYESANLPEANDIESGLLPRRLRELGYRLACQQEVHSDIDIHLPAETLMPDE
ncbi:MAG TPA: PepSY domain-containing protein [Xanthomonadales bacterium]